LAIRSLLHSSSSSKCVKGKAYNEKIQFAQTIIQDINTIITSTFEFLPRSRQRWCAREQIKLEATSADLMCIEESEEDEVEEQHFVEAQIVQKDAREENILALQENYVFSTSLCD
jgi:hypothetical protein